MQIGGPMQVDIAQCIIKMAAIHFKSEDILQAIEFQTKAIIILERLLGLENPLVALNYAKLAMYYHSTGYNTVAFDHMWRSLNIMQLSCGEYHPDIANIYLNLGLMYQEMDNNEAAIEVFQKYVNQNNYMFGKAHIQTAQANSALA
jgi:protein TIF31